MAYDSDAKMIILFGGWSTTTQFSDIWGYSPVGNAWTPLQPVGEAPAERALHQMVYDPATKSTVLFGGGTSSAVYGDTWLYDFSGRTWTQLAAGEDSPRARAGLAMAYDSSAQEVVLFGGSDGISTYFNDLWRLRR